MDSNDIDKAMEAPIQVSDRDRLIYTTGYPRSGTWWLTRLLSDLLDSPIRTLPPDNVTVDGFCRTGQGGYTILKTHLRSDQWDGRGKVVFIQRDPRDVAVSAMFYRSLEPTDDNLIGVIKTMTVERVVEGEKHSIYHRNGWYEKWVRGWVKSRWGNSSILCTRYEDLHKNHIYEAEYLSTVLNGTPLSRQYIRECFDRQRFDRHAANYPHAMRKGIIGDWKNHFKRQHGQLITEHLGQLMLEQGYIDRLDWWEGLPE